MTRTVSLAMAHWPAQDHAMWSRMIAKGHPLDGNGPLSHLRSTSLFGLTAAYERWLAWLISHQPEALHEPPEDRATVSRIIAWQKSLAHLSPYTSFSLIDRVMRILKAAATEADWAVQLHLVNGMRRAASRYHSTRKSGRILSSAVLFDLGKDLAGPQADAASTPLAAALLRRNGTLIAFLSALPMRRRALSELRLGQSLLISPTRIIVSLSPDMTKNGQPWNAPVQDILEPLLRRYIDDVRPWLLKRGGRDHDMLWAGKKSEPLSAGEVGSNIARSTLRATGKRISPHLFRDSAASTLARQSPGDALLIRPLLAHSGYGTAEMYYIQAQQIETGRDYASVVAQLTKGDD